VDLLLGDPTKARTILGWEPKVSFKELVKIMVDSDMKLAEREKKWGAFMTDPEWMKARAESEADGQIVGNIVSQILTPTAFSSVK